MERAEAMAIRPLGSDYLVEMIKPAERTAGGIYLPETVQENWQDARILRVSESTVEIDGFHIAVSQCEEGERIVFMQHHFRPLVDRCRFGLVADEHVMAVIADDTLYPVNDWVLIEPTEFVRQEGQVLLPEEAQYREQSGVVVDYGDGVLCRSGRNCGRRQTIRSIMNLAPDCPLYDQRVWWGRASEAYEIGSETVQGVLVQAEHLLFMEE